MSFISTQAFFDRLVPILPDPNRPYLMLQEREPYRAACGQVETATVSTVFLTASRCPVQCSMCDLHRNTLPQPTPKGAIARQIDFAATRLPQSDWIKLYNSGNWFDAASIPPSDYAEISERLEGYRRVIVENHPRFGLDRHAMFSDLITSRLEVAVGLESVQPRQLARLNKKMTRDDFDRYSRYLDEIGVGLRVFLIFGAPHQTIQEGVRWARLSAKHAASQGARHISLIPARLGNGWDGSGSALPNIGLRQLGDLVAEVLQDVGHASCVSVDLWDVDQDRLSSADQDFFRRVERAIERQEVGEL